MNVSDLELAGMTAEQRERYLRWALGHQGLGGFSQHGEGLRNTDATWRITYRPVIDCSRFWDAVALAVLTQCLEQLMQLQAVVLPLRRNP